VKAGNMPKDKLGPKDIGIWTWKGRCRHSETTKE